MAKSAKQIKSEKGLHPEIDKSCSNCKGQKMQVWNVQVDKNGIEKQTHKCPGCSQVDVITTEKAKSK